MHQELNERLLSVLRDAVEQGREVGAQVAVYRGGECVANAWYGIADSRDGRAVDASTLFPVFSATKAICATVIHRLVDSGKLAYDDLVCKHWPEFGCNGKENITVEHMLRHTAGIPNIPEGLTLETLTDWEKMMREMEGLTPISAPGKEFLYHAKTFGLVLAEVARRADGRPFDQLFRKDVAAPLKLDDLCLRVDADQDARVAFLIEPEVQGDADPRIPVIPQGAYPLTPWMNWPPAHRFCQPASSGMMTAEALARFYAALLPGGVDGFEVLSPERVAQATRLTELPDTGAIRRCMGYSVTGDGPAFGKKGFAIGHGGYGGSLGFVNLERGFSFAFTHNFFSPLNGDTLAQLVQIAEDTF